MIYIIKQEGLYQNKVNFSLVFTGNCKMGYCPNLKKFFSSKLDKFTLFTHSFVGWNLENRYKEGVSIFLR